jgi:hypothetical protein
MKQASGRRDEQTELEILIKKESMLALRSKKESSPEISGVI